MIALAWILLLSSSRVELVDEVYQIPASEWRYVDLGLRQQTALVTARYEVIAGPPRLRLALLQREDLEKLRAGAPHSVMDVTAESGSGVLNYRTPEAGDWVLVIDNQSRSPVSARIRVSLDFAGGGPAVTRLSPERQLTVIAISFAVFFGIVTYSARRLIKTMRR